jgi:hypothetical protein
VLRQVVLVAAVLTAVAAGEVRAALPPSPSTGVDIWGQPARTAEVAGRPLGTTIALFRSDRLASHLPTPSGLAQPLAVVAAHLRGKPGALIPSKTRRVATGAGPLFLVPTTHGWVCVQAQRFQTCHRGLLRQGITWNFYSTPTGLDVVGIAADDVTAVTLSYGTTRRKAELEHNVFFVHRPIALTSSRHLPPLGRLTISYRGTKRQASAQIN